MNNPESHDISSKILIVDDNPANIDVMIAFLEKGRYNLSIATNGEMALKVASHNLPDLILLDIMMPGIDGYEACRRLKKLPDTADIPVIFVTAKKEINDIVECYRCGGVDYIAKPVRQEELLARVKTHLQLRRMGATQNHLEQKLTRALAELETLRQILPSCSNCKKIRNEKNIWLHPEEFISSRKEGDTGRVICNSCSDIVKKNAPK